MTMGYVLPGIWSSKYQCLEQDTASLSRSTCQRVNASPTHSVKSFCLLGSGFQVEMNTWNYFSVELKHFFISKAKPSVNIFCFYPSKHQLCTLLKYRFSISCYCSSCWAVPPLSRGCRLHLDSLIISYWRLVYKYWSVKWSILWSANFRRETVRKCDLHADLWGGLSIPDTQGHALHIRPTCILLSICRSSRQNEQAQGTTCPQTSSETIIFLHQVNFKATGQYAQRSDHRHYSALCSSFFFYFILFLNFTKLY